ncbi:hypothetical protein B0T17DRAFT_502383 [Bombardia bombarda]|uniref:Uncharacterized protein n=1 Tax=Bombardia bombarda TaxID=252184 RepID=A0AA39XIR1_9PEZI|nr:hypothetical protein B0T17DRAFT_502383 [Bombardia bombarda]
MMAKELDFLKLFNLTKLRLPAYFNTISTGSNSPFGEPVGAAGGAARLEARERAADLALWLTPLPGCSGDLTGSSLGMAAGSCFLSWASRRLAALQCTTQPGYGRMSLLPAQRARLSSWWPRAVMRAASWSGISWFASGCTAVYNATRRSSGCGLLAPWMCAEMEACGWSCAPVWRSSIENNKASTKEKKQKELMVTTPTVNFCFRTMAMITYLSKISREA